MKKSFVLYTSLLPMIRAMDDENRGELLLAIFEYAACGTVIDITDFPIASCCFALIQEQLDDNAKKYELICQRNRENGQKNGRRKNRVETKQAQSNPMGYEQAQSNLDTEYDIESDNVNDNVSDFGERRKFTPPTINEVVTYCKERNNSIDAEQFVDFYASKGWKVGREQMKDWKAAVRTWERRGRDAPHENKKGTFDANEYLLNIINGGEEAQ